MERKYFVHKIIIIVFSLFLGTSALAQDKKTEATVVDVYFGKADKIRRAMIDNKIPESFPKATSKTTKEEYKKAVILWVSKNKHLIIPKHLAEFEAKTKQ